jgi:hypothetical protein
MLYDAIINYIWRQLWKLHVYMTNYTALNPIDFQPNLAGQGGKKDIEPGLAVATRLSRKALRAFGD